ncbi:hypothetical protein IJI72_00065 [Candidatus Saccharibacteria bacterium]|nr:hypothetical protein [Candidatus Saccharibacteria bacterium]
MPASSAFSDNLRENPSFSSSSDASEKPKPRLSADNLAFLNKIITAFPDLVFKPNKKFTFRPKKTIYYEIKNDHFPLLLLHETAHALLNHYSFDTSLERLTIERDAWEKTRSLCKKFAQPFDEDFAEANLNTYRDWLHQKTLCKVCGLTCLEVSSTTLFCPFCQKTYHR